MKRKSSWLLASVGLVFLGVVGIGAVKGARSTGKANRQLLPPEVAAAFRLVGTTPTDTSGASQWEADRRLTDDPGSARLAYNFARSVAADESGRVHVVWYDSCNGKEHAFYRRSVDGGKTWEPEVSLSDSSEPMPGDQVLPAVAVSGSNVYVAWHELRRGRTDVYFRRSKDGGTNWEPVTKLSTGPGGSAHASIAAMGSDVHVVFGDHRDGEQAEIYYKRSTDRGATWEAEKRLTDLPFDSWVPCVAASGKDVYLAWVDTRDGNEEEYVKISRNGGVTWGPDTRLTRDPANSWAPSVAVSGKTVHLVWFDQKDNPVHLLDAEKKLDEAMKLVGLPVEPTPTGVMVPHPEAAAKQRATEKMQLIHQAVPGWVRGGGDGRKLQRILREFEEMAQPKGFPEAEARLNEVLKLIGLPVESSQVGGAAAEDPAAMQKRIQAKVQKIQAEAPKWVQQGGDPRKLEAVMREFEQTVRAVRGASYAEKEQKLDEALKLMGLSYTPAPNDSVPKVHYGEALQARVQVKMRKIQAAAPSWAQRGGDLQKLEALLKEFHQTMELATREWEIYYRRSTDGAATWGPEVRLTNARGTSLRPSIAVAGNNLHVVWWDDRDGNNEVYYKHSADGGTTWGADVRLTTDPHDSTLPSVAVSRDSVHVVWVDTRDGNAEIYYKRKVTAETKFRTDAPDKGAKGASKE